MQKKLNGKLALSRETLRNLSPKDLDEVKGGATTPARTPAILPTPAKAASPAPPPQGFADDLPSGRASFGRRAVEELFCRSKRSFPPAKAFFRRRRKKMSLRLTLSRGRKVIPSRQ